MPPETPTDPSRRSFIKRSAIVGGVTLWATPVVQSFSHPAQGQVASPLCADPQIVEWSLDANGVSFCITKTDDVCLSATSDGTGPGCGATTAALINGGTTLRVTLAAGNTGIEAVRRCTGNPSQRRCDPVPPTPGPGGSTVYDYPVDCPSGRTGLRAMLAYCPE